METKQIIIAHGAHCGEVYHLAEGKNFIRLPNYKSIANARIANYETVAIVECDDTTYVPRTLDIDIIKQGRRSAQHAPGIPEKSPTLWVPENTSDTDLIDIFFSHI